MSQEKPVQHEDHISPTKTHSEPLNVEWSYSGKTMRTQQILYWLITLVLIGGGVALSVFGILGTGSVLGLDIYRTVWGVIIVILAVMWVSFLATYYYRTWTLKYRLTETRLYSMRGLFTKTTDSMELVYIEDVQLKQTLWDRLFNGGVGCLEIFSAADKTHSTLYVKGIDEPNKIFEILDNARAEIRKNRAVLSN
jgi:uncharacterized membrane protein YdbT with pleckstrin-like domain